MAALATVLGLLCFAIGRALGLPLWGNALFGTAPLAVHVWWFMLPFPLAMLALEELRRWGQVAG